MQAVLDAGLPQIVGITPTLILVQVALRRTAQDVEAHSKSPNAMDTRQMMSSKINFRVGPTTQPTSGGSDPEKPTDTIGTSPLNDEGCRASKEIYVPQGQSYALCYCDESCRLLLTDVAQVCDSVRGDGAIA